MMQLVTLYPLVALPAPCLGEGGGKRRHTPSRRAGRGICNQGLRDRKGCDERSGAQKQIPHPGRDDIPDDIGAH